VGRLYHEHEHAAGRGKQIRATGTNDKYPTGSAEANRNAAEGQASQHGDTVQAYEFQTFYQENLGQIYRYVYSKVGNREEAEDLTSQIFIKAVRGIDTERGTSSIQKWLFQVARTTIADYWRAYYRIAVSSLEELLEAGWEGPAEEEEHTLYANQPAERVERILQALPDHYREVLTCRFLLNLSIKETAQRMGITEANVKVLQFRALNRAADLEYSMSGIHS
jgi:RNA polymerase sigma-70 factor (ECF subfamily)